MESEIYLSNHVVFNENAGDRVTDSYKSSPVIALNIDWRTENALGSGHSPMVLLITCDLITHSYNSTKSFHQILQC